MKISILGCGWLGFPLGVHLKEQGFLVKGSSRDTNKLALLSKTGIQPFEINLTLGNLNGTIDAFYASDLLILTIPPGRKRPDVEEFYPTIVKAIIKTFIKNGGKKLIYTSSTSVYGNSKGLTSEQNPSLPNTAAGKAVLKAETYLIEENELEVTILRLAGLVGQQRHPGRWLSGRKDIPNGDAPVNLVHLADVIKVISSVIQQNAWGNIFNVCGNVHPTKKEYYSWATERLGLIPPTFLSGGANNKLIDASLVRQALELTFKFDNPYDFIV